MKRSEAIAILQDIIDQSGDMTRSPEDLLYYSEKILKMTPPPTPAKKFYGKKFSGGAMCSMRCRCDDCDPEFPVYKWEPENE